MLLIFIQIKRTFLLFSFDLILNLATNKQKRKRRERTKSERERENRERASEQRTSKQKASEQKASEQRTSEQRNERMIETNERDYKRMQL
jgi:uncharacterized protein YlxW (UPF0749 family)